MRKAYIFKAKLNRRTEANAIKWLELCRILYNTALEQRILLWNQRKISLSWYAQKREWPVLKAQFHEFKAVGSQVLQDVMQRVDRAYKGFYQRLKARKDETGFPRFKGKSRYDSFTLAQAGWKLEGKNLYVANVGRFKLFVSRAIEGGIKTITIRRSSTGKWFISFSCENVGPRAYPHTTQEIGIDVGIESFLRDSNNRAIEHLKDS